MDAAAAAALKLKESESAASAERLGAGAGVVEQQQQVLLESVRATLSALLERRYSHISRTFLRLLSHKFHLLPALHACWVSI